MKKFVMGATLALAAFVAVSASAATFVYQGGLIKMGSKGTQVYNLQKCLADMGVNSHSNIDGIFGAKTKAAVMAFQAKKGVAVDGIIGPVTGPLYTVACAEVSNTNDNSNNNSNNNSSNDNMSNEEADVTVKKVSKEEDLVNNKEDQLAFTFEVEADENGGDAKVERVDLAFTITPKSATSESDLHDIIEKVTVKGASKESKSTDDDDDWRKTESGVLTATASDYGVALAANQERGTVRISGLNTIVKSDETKEFKVMLDIADLDDDDMDIEIELTKVEIRYVDGAGVTAEEDKTSTKSVTIEGSDSLDIDLDKDKNQETSETISLSEEDKDGVSLMIGEFEVDEQDGELEDVHVTVDFSQVGTGADVDTDELVKEVTLYIDGKKVDDDDTKVTIADAATTGSVTYKFDADKMDIKDGKTYDIEVKADLNKLEDASKLAGAKMKVSQVVFKGEAENEDDFTVTESYTGTEVTASAGALVLEDISVKGYDKDTDAAATAKFTVELKADGDEDIKVTGFVFSGLDATDTTVVKNASVGATNVDYTIEVKEDDDNGDEVELDAADADADHGEDKLIKDGKKKTYYIEIFAAAKDGKTTKVEAELEKVTYTIGASATVVELTVEKESDEIVVSN